jgi:RHS repeat-associated protein
LTITRMAFTDTAGVWPGPFTIVPLWTMRGYADTSYFAETGYTNCTPTPPNTPSRCMRVSYPAEYWMPVWRFAPASTAFNGSLLVDKADASGQLYRRNRYYDPASGRFTQEDPIGLAGGLNAYGFADGDPVNFSDPFGLCPLDQGSVTAFLCNAIEATTTFVGSTAGFIAGGGAGALAAAPTAELAAPVSVPAGAIAGAATGAVAGKLAGEAITNVLFSKRGGDFRGGKQSTRDPDHERLMKEFKPDRRQETRIHEEIGKQKKGGTLDYDDLRQIFIDVMGRRP